MQNPPDIDTVRSVLCCLCYEDEFAARPVHINHVNAYLLRYFPVETSERLLGVLESLQEFVKLPKGYWYPASLRQIPWIDSSIIVGPQSTPEIQRALGLCVSVAGNGRVLFAERTDRIPIQALDDWMRRPPNLVAWGIAALSNGRARMTATITSGEQIEIYVPTEKSRWVTVTKRTRIADGTYLCRRRLSEFHRPYFLGQLRSNVLNAETELTDEHIRLRYAIDASFGVQNSFRCLFRSDSVVLQFGYRLPTAERRLMLALGTSIDPDARAPAFEISRKFFPAVQTELKKAGLARGVHRI